jgi:hypothetical protein
MNKIIFTLLLLFASTISANEIDQLCKNPWQERDKAICADKIFLSLAREFEPHFWHAARQSKTVGDFSNLQKTKWDFESKLFLNCSPIGYSLPKKASEYTTCLRNAVESFRQSFAAAYPDSANAEIIDRESELAAAKKRVEEFIDQQTSQVALCRINTANKLDDNVSPASDIAIAVASTCKKEAISAVNLTVNKINGSLFPFSWFSSVKGTAGVVEQIIEEQYGSQATISLILKLRSARASQAKEQIERQRQESIQKEEERKKAEAARKTEENQKTQQPRRIKKVPEV